jgi:hypothetical protein
MRSPSPFHKTHRTRAVHTPKRGVAAAPVAQHCCRHKKGGLLVDQLLAPRSSSEGDRGVEKLRGQKAGDWARIDKLARGDDEKRLGGQRWTCRRRTTRRGQRQIARELVRVSAGTFLRAKACPLSEQAFCTRSLGCRHCRVWRGGR